MHAVRAGSETGGFARVCHPSHQTLQGIEEAFAVALWQVIQQSAEGKKRVASQKPVSVFGDIEADTAAVMVAAVTREQPAFHQ